MQIEVFQQDEGLSGEREAWVRVLSNELLTWPAVKDILKNEERLPEDFYESPNRYYPHLVTPAEEKDHGFTFEDWWILPETAGSKTRREQSA